MARVLLSCHYHQSSLYTSSLMKHVDICYFNFTSMLSLFHEHFPSGCENLHTSFYECELNQGIKTTRFHVAVESIDGGLRGN